MGKECNLISNMPLVTLPSFHKPGRSEHCDDFVLFIVLQVIDIIHNTNQSMYVFYSKLLLCLYL